MKTLFVMRHGKSSWENPELDDFRRPLLPKGEKRTLKVARHIQKSGTLPDLIISSPAVRARQTASLVAEVVAVNFLIEQSLYLCHSRQIADLVFTLDDDKDVVMIVAHNPALTYFVNEYLGLAIDRLPTSGLAGAVFDISSWTEFSGAVPLNNFLITPKTLQ